MIYHASASSYGKTAVAFSTGEGEMSRAERPCIALISVACGVLLVYAPVIYIMVCETLRGVTRRRCRSHLGEIVGRSAEHDMVFHGR